MANLKQSGILRCICGRLTWSSEGLAAKGLAHVQLAHPLEEQRAYECNWVPGSWHLTGMSVADALRFVFPPSPPSGSDQPLLDVIAELMVAAIKMQGPGLMIPVTGLRKHFRLSGGQVEMLKRQLMRTKWMRRYVTSEGHFTTWPHHYAQEHGPRVASRT